MMQPILIVDDSEADIYFLKRAIRTSRVQNPVLVFHKGRDFKAYLETLLLQPDAPKAISPGVIFIDLRMPDLSGFDLIQWAKQQKTLEKTLLVAVSNSTSLGDINKAYKLGAHTFLAKPLQGADVYNLVKSFEEYWKVQPFSMDLPLN